MRGTVNGIEITSRVIFLPGNSNGDGYWTNIDLTIQLKDVIPLFNELHPDCIGIFAFDQSSNHKDMADDALVASRMSSGVTEYKDTNKYRFRDTTFTDKEGRVKAQPMYRTETVNMEGVKKIVATRRAKQQPVSFEDLMNQYRLPRAREVFRGTLILLRERGLLDKNASLRKVCPSGTVHDPAVRPGCCAEYLLSQQPDFLAQKNILETVTFEAGHLFTLYPKYHCETNWIERQWGAAKRYSRMMCDYSFYTLTSRIHEFLDNDEVVHGPKINRRYYNLAYRYIDAYRKGKDVMEADEIIRKFSREYRSHRRAV
ncbi:uncharacterized protein EV154DRAFT_569848 [Mucor mucedo]|uniref:uncharacterized protein n=1 Tax=Mucor mucedo TaxID=29922 RepID=UPI00222100C7|nr:uncharacterized protein EV154DRAFT_569848 [Mucor mucedo]KAI7874006.1 hypothetical protein EV154DRAFT_569848 [Mucor mucedo]